MGDRSGAPGRASRAPALINFRYDLTAKLADGPVLDTWRAVDRVRETTVVVKLLRTRWSADEKTTRRWLQSLARQRDNPLPHAAAVLDAGRDHEYAYLVREFVEGPSLERWMNQHHGYDEILDCATNLLRVLADWHEVGLCHGQLHPGNLILAADGPRITDWDLAASTLNCFGVLASRRKHRVYLAPEIRETYTATPGSDVYSVGVALWELVTGRRLATEAEAIPPPSSVNPALPPGVDVVVDGMLKPDPDDRYPAAQAAEALGKLRSRAESRVESSPRERRRQRARERAGQALPPLPWPVTVILVFYRFLFILLFTGLVSGATLGGMGFLSYRYLVDSIPSEVIVPDVTGKPVAEAQTLLQDQLGLRFQVTLRQASGTIPEGHVITTRPTAGRKVREGRTIDAVVSTGAELITVPRIVETTVAQATEMLARLGLKVGVKATKPSLRVPAGSILSQSPGPGRRVPAGIPVAMYVSSGPETPEEAAPTVIRPGQPVEEPAEAGAKKVGRVKITVPGEPNITWVKIVVRDDDGERTVYNELRYAGDVVLKNVEGRGETVVEVFLNGHKVQSKVL